MVYSLLVELNYHTKPTKEAKTISDNIIQLNEDLIKHDLKNLVSSSAEETLNALIDKESDDIVNAQKYERSGYYKRNFQTTAGEVELKVPKFKGDSFETAIFVRSLFS